MFWHKEQLNFWMKCRCQASAGLKSRSVAHSTDYETVKWFWKEKVSSSPVTQTRKAYDISKYAH